MWRLPPLPATPGTGHGPRSHRASTKAGLCGARQGRMSPGRQPRRHGKAPSPLPGPPRPGVYPTLLWALPAPGAGGRAGPWPWAPMGHCGCRVRCCGAPLVLGAMPGALWVLAGCRFRGCPLQGHGVSLRPGSCPHSHWPQLRLQVFNGLRGVLHSRTHILVQTCPCKPTGTKTQPHVHACESLFRTWTCTQP